MESPGGPVVQLTLYSLRDPHLKVAVGPVVMANCSHEWPGGFNGQLGLYAPRTPVLRFLLQSGAMQPVALKGPWHSKALCGTSLVH